MKIGAFMRLGVTPIVIHFTCETEAQMEETQAALRGQGFRNETENLPANPPVTEMDYRTYAGSFMAPTSVVAPDETVVGRVGA